MKIITEIGKSYKQNYQMLKNNGKIIFVEMEEARHMQHFAAEYVVSLKN